MNPSLPVLVTLTYPSGRQQIIETTADICNTLVRLAQDCVIRIELESMK